VRSPPSFWWRPERSAASLALAPLARLWGMSSARRMARPPAFQAPMPVVCVGNFVLGGAGKTPTALALWRIARDRGFTPGFLASGYGGAARGEILVDAATDKAAMVGDEPLLLAAVAPTVIGRDRAAAAKRLIATGIDLIIMDDGFQNPRLAKDLSFAVVDSDVGIGNGAVFPAGPLRAPLEPQLRRADALIVVGEGTAADPLVRAAARAGRAILRARLAPAADKAWGKQPILAFAGIGRPQKFYASLAALKAPVGKTMSFADHHRFSDTDAERLMAHADAAGLRLVTTEKDMARLCGETGAVARLRERAETFPIRLEFENPVAIGAMIEGLARRIGTLG
jgi:tetraacyldisaccharide 4'-kinase